MQRPASSPLIPPRSMSVPVRRGRLVRACLRYTATPAPSDGHSYRQSLKCVMPLTSSLLSDSYRQWPLDNGAADLPTLIGKSLRCAMPPTSSLLSAIQASKIPGR